MALGAEGMRTLAVCLPARCAVRRWSAARSGGLSSSRLTCLGLGGAVVVRLVAGWSLIDAMRLYLCLLW